MTKLTVNVDHFATLRNARGGIEPNPVTAAILSELYGATGIVVHLREDRRHIKDTDVISIKESINCTFDFEMAATPEIISFAYELSPDLVTIVPEKRQELTTEGGLDLQGSSQFYEKVISGFSDRNIPVSLFVEPNETDIELSQKIGATIVELHTGHYANSKGNQQRNELEKIKTASSFAHSLGLRVVAGHGLSYTNTFDIAVIPEIEDVSIGHSLVSRAMFFGLERAVKDMLHILEIASLQS
jgi:pyridoxine 5-phosphate synthase